MNILDQAGQEAGNYIFGYGRGGFGGGGVGIANAQGYFHAGNVSGLIDVNASTERVYPRGYNNSMNKKLEAAKQWLKKRDEAKKM